MLTDQSFYIIYNLHLIYIKIFLCLYKTYVFSVIFVLLALPDVGTELKLLGAPNAVLTEEGLY